MNKNKKNFNSNKYLIKQETINSERQSEKFKNKLFLTNIKNRDNDNDIMNNNNDINELFKQKYNLQFHSKLFFNHQTYNIDKQIGDLFTGFCKEPKHRDILEFFWHMIFIGFFFSSSMF